MGPMGCMYIYIYLYKAILSDHVIPLRLTLAPPPPPHKACKRSAGDAEHVGQALHQQGVVLV